MAEITLFLVGDVMIGRSFNKLFEGSPNYNIWSDQITALTKKGDFVGINLETTITDHQEKFPDKVFNFRLSSKYKNILKKLNVTYANLANNHSLDYQTAGLMETVNNLDTLGIQHSGAGVNIFEAMKPLIFEIKDTKIGIISASDHPENFAATEAPGIFYLDIAADWTPFLQRIKIISKTVDILIFSMHHGSNYVAAIPNRTKEFFRSLIDHGVKIIHGHSAHHVLPIEKYRDGFIFYSFGDFIDDYAVDANYRNDLSFLAQINIKDKKIYQVAIYPTRITIDHVNGVLYPRVNLLKKSDSDYQFVKNHAKLINVQNAGMKKYKFKSNVINMFKPYF